MSDHWDAPDLKSPNMDARVDISDIDAFQKPEDASKSVLVFNVNPVAPNRIEPTRDRELFARKFTDRLASFGRSPENAQQIALTLLPDILDYDYSSASGFPDGRKLTDDIVDIQIAVLTNGAKTTDKVGPHQDLLTTFPHVGPAHPIV